MTDRDIAIRVLSLAAAFEHSDLDDIGPTKDFIDAKLVQHSMSQDDVSAIVQRGKEAIRNSNAEKIRLLADAGGEILGILRGIAL